MKRALAPLLAGALFLGILLASRFGGESPGAGGPQNRNPGPAGDNTGLGLVLPEGFGISVLADRLPAARSLAFDAFGHLWVSQPPEGLITRIEIENGGARDVRAAFRNLRRPHGLAVDPETRLTLYFTEETGVSAVRLYSDEPPRRILPLPGGGGHDRHTLGFGPDGKLYISIGSTCDVCEEKNPVHATIHRMDRDGGAFEAFARGLRNAAFFTWHPATRELWTTEMGRDWLGENLPPDEVNIVRQGRNYGWPICYGQRIHDTAFDTRQYFRDPCEDTEPAHIDIPAHSAPLGIAFIPDSWPEEYRGDLLIALHGSWNRSQPAGYKIVRYNLGPRGEIEEREASGRPQARDFISGWLPSRPNARREDASGRPAGLAFGPDGALYISDDHSGKIYRVSYNGSVGRP